MFPRLLLSRGYIPGELDLSWELHPRQFQAWGQDFVWAFDSMGIEVEGRAAGLVRA